MTAKDDYQSLNQELEYVLDKLQASDVHVDEAVKLYEEGIRLVRSLEKYLHDAEIKVQILKKDTQE